LYTSSIDGTNLFQVVPFSFDVAVKQDWAPDGRRLVFSENADDFDRPANIATIRPDGTGLRYLTDLPSREAGRTSVATPATATGSCFRVEDHGRYGLYRMRPDGGAGAGDPLDSRASGRASSTGAAAPTGEAGFAPLPDPHAVEHHAGDGAALVVAEAV
jgi:hypothetical protein